MRNSLKKASICVPIVAVSDEEVERQVKKIVNKKETADIEIAEFRADYYNGLNDYIKLKNILSKIHTILNKIGVKLLFTIRSQAEGGEVLDFDTPDINEINLYVAENKLADMIDIECFSDRASADNVIITARNNDIKTLLSSHDFEKTPSFDDMVKRYMTMQERHTDIIKLAVMPHDNQDVENLLNAVSETYEKYPETQVVGISMGELGRRTRIEGYKYGSCLTFAVIEKASAPGQVNVDDIK